VIDILPNGIIIKVMKISAVVMIVLLVMTSITRAEITARDVWIGLLIASKVITKTQSGTWGASVHEEVHQGVKDAVRKAGEK
jgi:hypothetical protein